MRRTLFIIAAVVVGIGILAVVYFFFFAPTASIQVAPAQGSSATTLPSAGNTAPASVGNSAGNSGASTPVPVATATTPRLVEIDKGPVVPGMLALDIVTPAAVSSMSSTSSSQAATSSDVRVSYLERGSGNVFTYLVAANTGARTSNRTIPGIEKAVWAPDGSRVYIQYLSGTDASTVNTYALPADGSTGSFLPAGVAGLAVATGTVDTLASGTNGSIATSFAADGSNAAQVFATPLSSLRIAAAGKSLFAFTKPSGILSGYVYSVIGGVFSRIEGPRAGLVALPGPLGKHMLISYVESGVLKLELLDLVAHTALALPVGTIADKCVWAPDESTIYCGVPVNLPAAFVYPDDWYQGAVSLSDRIWKINVEGRYAALVLDFSAETNSSLDIDSLTVDAAKKEIVFRNKVDGSLWGFQL